jgi:hypothetical protein
VPVTGDDAGLTQLAAPDRLPVRCSDRFAAPAVSAGLRLLQPVGEVFGAGTEQHSTQFFYLCPQMLYLALFVLFSSARASAERRNDSVSATRLS